MIVGKQKQHCRRQQKTFVRIKTISDDVTANSCYTFYLCQVDTLPEVFGNAEPLNDSPVYHIYIYMIKQKAGNYKYLYHFNQICLGQNELSCEYLPRRTVKNSAT